MPTYPVTPRHLKGDDRCTFTIKVQLRYTVHSEHDVDLHCVQEESLDLGSPMKHVANPTKWRATLVAAIQYHFDRGFFDLALVKGEHTGLQAILYQLNDIEIQDVRLVRFCPNLEQEMVAAMNNYVANPTGKLNA